MRHARLYGSALTAMLMLTAVGCDDDDGDGDGSEMDAGTDAGGDGDRDGGTDARADSGGGGGDDGGADGGPMAECPDIDDREEVLVSGEIDSDTTWTCDKKYVLTERVYVVGDATLTIEAGTEVQGDISSALLVTTEGRLVTEGTASSPVVFTSSNAPGSRQGGDWGGVVLLGRAPINVSGGTNSIEGLNPSDMRHRYGGSDADHDCGHIRYTRIEWAGEEYAPNNELNSLTLGGCGSDTVVEYLQTHRGLDDGVEFFGGSPTVHHVVVSYAEDDSFDWDYGFSSAVQFVAVLQDPENSDKAIEADNNNSSLDADPRSNPTLYNATFVGGRQGGWHARRGTWGTLSNAIFMGFGTWAVDIDSEESAAGAEMDPPQLIVQNSIFYENGSGGTAHFPVNDMNDGDFDEDAFFRDDARDNQFDVDPELDDPENGKFVPAAGSPAASGGATPPSGLDTSATYVGAFEPGGEDWTEGWTAYPEG